MKLVVGLGNPGVRYVHTRHNVGFVVADLVAQELHAPIKSNKHKSILGEATVAGEKIVIAKPQTFMNLSGQAVVELANWYKIRPNDIIVIHDDLDLETGRLKLKKGGGHGGHNGLKSIFQCLGSKDFMRVRIGVGRPPEYMEVVDYVLGRPTKEEVQSVNEAIDRASDGVLCIIKEGLEKAMNQFN